MSDIGLHFDGLIALLATLAVDGVLLLGFAVCASLAWIKSRRTKAAIRSQPLYRHMAGILACVLVYSCVGVGIFLHGLKSSSSPLEAWMDRWVLVWLPAVLLLWPVSAARIKKRQVFSEQGRAAGVVCPSDGVR